MTDIQRELRRDPITGTWVVLVPELARQPGQFLHQDPLGECRLCAGREKLTPPELLAFRDWGAANEPGWRVRVIPSFAPVLRVEGTLESEGVGLYDRMSGIGAHELVVEGPDHGVALGDHPSGRVTEILLALRERMVDLRRDHRLRYVAAFKNHGEQARARSDHGLWQIVGLPLVPHRVAAEAGNCLRHWEMHGRCVTCDVMRSELAEGRRVISTAEAAVVLSPYAAKVPFETWILPRGHESHFENTPHHVLEAVAGALRDTVRRMDAVLERPEYNVTLQSAPLQEQAMAHYHWRLEVVPRVARGVGAGFEWATHAHVNPTSPEEAARFLRETRVD